MRILVVEDDEYVSRTLKILFTHYNYAVDVAAAGTIGLQLVDTFEYDVVILDVILPDLNGVSLCQQLRKAGYQMPILLLTGRGGGHEKAVALNAGADDYVVKPFHPEELVARIQALLRRGGTIARSIMVWGALRLDTGRHTATYGSHALVLTPKEYAFLELFLRNNQRVYSSRSLLDRIWTFEEAPGEESVRGHIKELRKKLKAVGAPADFIETVHRVGYRLKPLDTFSNSPGDKPLTPLSSSEDSGFARLQHTDDTQQRTMIVTKNTDLFAFLRILLEPQGLQTIFVNHSSQFWKMVKACSPTLLILDVETPALNSLELCQRVRQDSHLQGLPIVFLLPYKDTERIYQVFAAGADDIVSQPIVGPEFIARVTSCLR